MEQIQITLAEPGRFERSPGVLPSPASGEARIRIRRIGVCGTDIHAFHGRQPFFEYPRILGHELGAEVVSVNGNSDLLPGEIVAVEPYLKDPDSPASRKGKANCCESLKVLGVHCDGGMRPEINVPLSKLHRTRSATMDQLALVEMLCIGKHAVNRSLASPADTALVLGAGPIGLSVLSFLKGSVKSLAAADINLERLDFCRHQLGVDETLPAGPNEKMQSDLREIFGGELPSLIFDATGNRDSMLSCFDLAAHGARIVYV